MLCLTLHPPGGVPKHPDGTYVSFTITKPCTFDVKVLGSCKERVMLGINGDPKAVQCVRSNAKEKEKYAK